MPKSKVKTEPHTGWKSKLVQQIEESWTDSRPQIERILVLKSKLSNRNRASVTDSERQRLYEEVGRANQDVIKIWRRIFEPFWETIRANVGLAEENIGNLLQCQPPRLPRTIADSAIPDLIAEIQNAHIYCQATREEIVNVYDLIVFIVKRATDAYMALSFHETVSEAKAALAVLIPADILLAELDFRRLIDTWSIRADSLKTTYEMLSRMLTAKEAAVGGFVLTERKREESSYKNTWQEPGVYNFDDDDDEDSDDDVVGGSFHHH